ncbi:MAG: hypothetical protein ACOYT4_00640 [Nanoarchaeota archaeon]
MYDIDQNSDCRLILTGDNGPELKKIQTNFINDLNWLLQEQKVESFKASFSFPSIFGFFLYGCKWMEIEAVKEGRKSKIISHAKYGFIPYLIGGPT